MSDAASGNFLSQLAELHPRSSIILEAWVRLEVVARSPLSRDGRKEPNAAYIPVARLSEPLVNAGIIDQSQVTLYHELRRPRNEVAHSVALEPMKEAAQNYVELSRSLQSQLDRAP